MKLPDLPLSLEKLGCRNKNIEEYLPFPVKLSYLQFNTDSTILKIEDNESQADFNKRINNLREDYNSMFRCQKRCRAIKEDLIAEVMHPRRIERLIEAGGFEALDCF